MSSSADSQTAGSARTSIDPDEVAKFAAMAEAWWDPDGDFKPLHKMNPTRVRYVREAVERQYAIVDADQPLAELSILDAGCGGGLLSEPLARLGGTVTGLDAVARNCEVAALHAEQSGLPVTYQAGTVEDLAETGAQFDVVTALEIIEHVANPAAFVESLARVAKPDGIIIVSTFNRTLRSFGLGIVAAEYVLGWLPKGTHDWNKFVRPAELARMARRVDLDLVNPNGMSYDPLKDRWSLSQDTGVNYIATLKRM